MNIITTLAASVLMSPANVATDVPAAQMEPPIYDWQTQKLTASVKANIGRPTSTWSTTNTSCMWMGRYSVDDYSMVD